MSSDQRIEEGCSYDLSIATVFQDEAPYLREWIEFHKMMGVQRFILVDDRSSDNYQEALQPYIDAGEVDLVHRPCPPHLLGKKWIDYQLALIRAFCEQLRGVTRWLALIDVDEFILPTETDNVVQFLSDYEHLGGVYIRWEPFGTSYIEKLPDGALITERLHLKGQFKRGRKMLGKSIVKPHRVLQPNIHRCGLLPGYDYMDSNPDMQNEAPQIKVHHYWSRDQDFLFNAKLPRTAKIKGWDLTEGRLEYFKHLFNEVPDHTMKKFAPELRRRILASH